MMHVLVFHPSLYIGFPSFPMQNSSGFSYVNTTKVKA
jgi:hypothetical protein